MSLLSIIFVLGLSTFSAFAEVSVESYVVGRNNRRIIQALVTELEQKHGIRANVAYGAEIEATIDKISINEKDLDKFWEFAKTPKDKEAFIRFIIAHEYFHVALGHPDLADGRKVAGVKDMVFMEDRRNFERQVNHLATREVIAAGLPIDVIRDFFKSDLYPVNDHYPPAEEQLKVVESALLPSVDESIFNEGIDCRPLLRRLAGF